MALSAVLTALAVGCTYLVCELCRRYLAKSCLDHIPGPKQTSLILSGFSGITSRDGWAFMDTLANEFGGVVKHRDILGNTMAYVTDPVALNSILVKDSHKFEEPEQFLIATRLLFGPGILSAIGDNHRKQRKIMNPIFSTGNLRSLTPVLASIGDSFRRAIAARIENGARDVDMHKWCSRVILEMAGRTVLDYSFDPLTEDKENDFATAIENAHPTLHAVPLHFLIAMIWVKFFGVVRIPQWVATWYPSKRVKKAKETWDTTWMYAERLVDEKIATMFDLDRDDHEEKRGGRDVLSLLVKENMSAKVEDRMSHEEVVAQVNTMIFGSVESSTNVISRILHVLAIHPDAQDKLRREITAALAISGEIVYEQVSELPYLDAVYRETIRAYPPIQVMNREVQEQTMLPLGRPIKDINGRMVHEIVLDKGTTVTIGVHGFNRSKAFWGQDATDWKPERWLSPLPDQVNNTPSGGLVGNILTFLGGPRSCIGFKYAEIELKMMLCSLLPSFKFSLGDEDIVWNTARVVYPSVTSRDSDGASMPLRVEKLTAADI